MVLVGVGRIIYTCFDICDILVYIFVAFAMLTREWGVHIRFVVCGLYSLEGMGGNNYSQDKVSI